MRNYVVLYSAVFIFVLSTLNIMFWFFFWKCLIGIGFSFDAICNADKVERVGKQSYF